MRAPEFEKFLSEKRPQLLWEMEIDCFEVGDQQQSALRMLKHLETNLTHKDAPEWIEDFKGLISHKKE
jgi:esterase/lipase superfamily enzyme